MNVAYFEQRAEAGFATTPSVSGAVAPSTGVKLSVADLGLTYNLSPALNVVCPCYQTTLAAHGINSTKMNTYVLRSRYALSKSTDLYAELVESSFSGIAASATSAIATNDAGITAGVQVRF